MKVFKHVPMSIKSIISLITDKHHCYRLIYDDQMATMIVTRVISLIPYIQSIIKIIIIFNYGLQPLFTQHNHRTVRFLYCTVDTLVLYCIRTQEESTTWLAYHQRVVTDCSMSFLFMIYELGPADFAGENIRSGIQKALS